jgi:hypothetical protein
MAKVFPSLEQIRKFTPAAEPGELALIEFLARELDDTYEVFFQPMMDGDKPDAVILREGCGVAIIEVKDWNLSSYQFTKECLCRIKSNGALRQSPIKQVHNYKEHLINLYIPDLGAETAVDRRLFAVVSTAVYFHCARELDLNAFFPSEHNKWTQLLGVDSLDPRKLAEILEALHLDRESTLFRNAGLYHRFRRFLAPPTHTLDQGHDLSYTPEQRQLAVSKPEGKKIAGVAGAGKTYVLAKRAVNAYVRTRRPVLVLTFNITLKNYIHDRISEVREAFDWSNFCITNYHRFFATQANRYELPCSFSDDANDSSFSDERFFEPVAHKIEDFSAIFIDEVQDYKIEWLRIVKKYFLASGGEYVLCGDEKQNLYDRPLESKAIRTNIPGPFARMKTSQRLNTRLAELASKFQAEFFKPRHEVEVIQSMRQQSLFESRVEYRYCGGADSQQLMQIIMSYLNRWGVHPNDASILCSRNEDVRKLDSVVRGTWRQHTTVCCETQKEFDALARINPDGIPEKFALEGIRRSRRYNFWMNTGKMKLCTVHSFKGWECSTIFLIIDKQRFNDDVNDELIYTAFTRCRDNLVVISLGENRYHDFFRREVCGAS